MVWYATLKVNPRGRLGGEQLERVTNGKKQVAIGTKNESASFFELVADDSVMSHLQVWKRMCSSEEYSTATASSFQTQQNLLQKHHQLAIHES
jgi:hypothetical protein